nr:unnamed protein product [Digitaria exilis]
MAADEVLRQPGLDGLQELELFYFPPTIYEIIDVHVRLNLNPAPPPLSRFSPTLRVLSLCCRRRRRNIRSRLEFPAAAEVAAGLLFPHLDQLTLKGVNIPESTLHGILSGCHALKSLVLRGNGGYDNLRISSRTLRSLGVSGARDSEGEIVAMGHVQNVMDLSNDVKSFVSLECLDGHLKILELKGDTACLASCTSKPLATPAPPQARLATPPPHLLHAALLPRSLLVMPPPAQARLAAPPPP